MEHEKTHHEEGSTHHRHNTEKRMLVTSALPYANGPIHIGHLVEYIETDIFVRSQKLLGKDVIYCCADDTHGAPISINAEKQGITPEELIGRYNVEHQEDFKKFLINFDNYYSTNSPENKTFSDLIFSRLKARGDIYEKDLELTYCEHCKRFLPDRYVKGKCPKCGAEDQYGDVCEKCNAAYSTTDLVEPFCVLCKKKPTTRVSRHFFFKLSNYKDFLHSYLTNNKNLQPEVRNQILSWVNDELKDWCISRDGPYFGFQIPGTDKFYYVWLDAPIGYISSTKNYCDRNGRDVSDYWGIDGRSTHNSEVIHVIGKDIIYFHLLFWPAMLHGASIKLPDDFVVHGFLTVNGEKMSKSRGTFLSAKEFLEHGNPEHLRFYYAANLSKTMTDINLDFDEFKSKVNSDLVSNVANFFYRCTSMLYKNFGGELVEPDSSILLESSNIVRTAYENYSAFEFRKAVSDILRVSALGNSYMQQNEPWKLVNTDKEKAQKVLSTCVGIAKDLCVAIKPILPEFAKEIEREFGIGELDCSSLSTVLSGKILEPKIYFTRLENFSFGKKKFLLDLRVAKIESVERHPNAEKLYIEHIDFGPLGKRTIVSGIVQHYTAEELVGKHIVVVTNLEPAVLRGVKSEGMLLAGEENGTVGLVFADFAEPGTSVIPDGYEPNASTINIKEFAKMKLAVVDGKVTADGEILKALGTDVKVERIKNGNVR